MLIGTKGLTFMTLGAMAQPEKPLDLEVFRRQVGSSPRSGTSSRIIPPHAWVLQLLGDDSQQLPAYGW